ncbi:MAG: hydrogenase expression/formation C-terminal domain-containing protein [Xanthomonadales bacterium]|jgi:hydrogenase-1 operon protein HyaF|nr:hydrogenase expression/formation C-terminal domain-containing protein [Xanthomonadales bacterium]
MHSNGAPCQTENITGMARSIVAEVARMLESLATDGTTSSIDLRSLPLTEADRQQLEELLGRGEVTAELEVSGRSSVWETAYAGAWWIRHRGAGDKISSEEIAVCPVPGILVTHAADIEAAALRIKQEILENHPSQAEATNG